MAQFFTKTTFFSTPQIVGAVSSADVLRELAETQASPATTGCDLAELRLDQIDLPPNEIAALAGKLALPLLITARHPDEGGKGNLTLEQRTRLLQALLPRAAVVDVELRSAAEMLTLIRKAQNQRVQVIGSFHDFQSTPSSDVIRGAVDMALQCRLDAVKLATHLRDAEDLDRLLHVLATDRRLPLSVMGMGDLGRVSRLVLAKCGSVLNYGYLGEANAPGQWPVRRLKELLAEI